MWDPPGPELEPVSPALAGGFLTTVPPGKSPHLSVSAIPLGCRERAVETVQAWDDKAGPRQRKPLNEGAGDLPSLVLGVR